ncbi:MULTISPECIES: class I SAM-dependent methyltransferase [Methylococcus]|uniref:Class I SAM-dependent methyltransferase n=1 Tax=Methylococcus capsulatus TaxID=414 RepID=A0ABZ2F7Y4_METCP|nr:MULTISPECIES: class I SAM-dependent methyltransferase [Methylococcus]MDF9391162.1 class I SAM-dependent methyltransferase [Methylococcus capsulatus]
MERKPEPELMEDEAQALAYAQADFSEAHDRFVALFTECFPGEPGFGICLDLGCGPADVLVRFARAHPACRLDGIDGAAAMLALAQRAVDAARLRDRVRLIRGYLPGAELPGRDYDAVISNSLLHHLAAPSVLWETAKRHARPGAALFVMDLLRPDTLARLDELVERHAADAPPLLRRDFRNSLHAAYRPDEVRLQLDAAGLGSCRVAVVSDHHWIAFGRL